ncbi:MAG: C69 family dipeptidase [Bacteroidales bacterium]|nr:C69 family dipeptidase [Bacteroidales bacterium]
MICKKLILVTFFFSAFLFTTILCRGQKDHFHFNCYTVLVGKDASSDGSVLVAHNEDDWGAQIVNMYKVPATKHKRDSFITLKNGAQFNQVTHTKEYWWIEMPTMEFSDTYLNEHGVMIVSDACMSKEENPEITEGGIGYYLRRIMAERSTSAKDAVKIAGFYVEKYGYTGSGRTYCIADPNEAWMMSVVNGKQWIAQRVPDDHVAVIPNYYTISYIDLNDTLNFLGSVGLTDHAISSEIYNPETDGEFNFRKVYSNEKTLDNLNNKSRHWIGMQMLSGDKWSVEDNFPFSFKPKTKIAPSDLFALLRSHYEGTDLDISKDPEVINPHAEESRAVCANHTQYGIVGQLRSWLPPEVGNVMWISFRRPCVTPFIPWYYGIKNASPEFTKSGHKQALIEHFDRFKNIYDYKPDHIFLNFVKYAGEVDEDYYKKINDIKEFVAETEAYYLNNQEAFENDLLGLFSSSPDEACDVMTEDTQTSIYELTNNLNSK